MEAAFEGLAVAGRDEREVLRRTPEQGPSALAKLMEVTKLMSVKPTDGKHKKNSST